VAKAGRVPRAVGRGLGTVGGSEEAGFGGSARSGALRRLPTRARHVFVLFDVEGWTHEDIAETLGVSVGTSKSQLHRARMLMREELNR
jgi:RNA polymerase sigma-70 factor, ECF subfamily